MQVQSQHIRRPIVPDISVKLLDLCLSPDESGILMPPVQRRSKMLEYCADLTLKELISQRLKDKEAAVPLVMRKRNLYEKSKAAEKEEPLEEVFFSKVAPITMRKHLLHKQCRAG